MEIPKNKPAAQKVAQALTGLLLAEPFFGHLLLQLKLLEDETVRTECTNGVYIKYNPTFIASLPFDKVKSEFIHEIMHPAKLHPWRCDGRDHDLWNVACDYIINGELDHAGYTLDETWLLDHKYDGMSEEQVYNVVAEQPKEQQQQQIVKCYLHGQVEAAQDNSQTSKMEQEQNWIGTVLQAAQQAQQYGTLPGFLQTMVNEIKNPVVDWKSVLRQFIQQASKSDYSWARPNRRFLGLEVYLPSVKSEKLPPICVYDDTSGSRWSKKQLAFAKAEIASIIEDAKPERTYLIHGDTEVTNVEVFEAGDSITFNPKGGGGTSFEPIFKWIEEQGIEPCCFIGITDLEGSFPNTAPDYPVIWCCDVKGATAPFGEVIEVPPI